MESIKDTIAVVAVGGFSVYATNALGYSEASGYVAGGVALVLIVLMVLDMKECGYEPYE